MKQTAVEWYHSKVIELMTQREQGNIDVLEFRNQLDLSFKQAKEMEKEQIIEAYHEGQLCILDIVEKSLVPMGFESTSDKEDKEDANEYYKQTFKSE